MVDWVLKVIIYIPTEGIVNNCHGFGEKLQNVLYGGLASKLLENGLGTRRRTSYLLTASGVGTRSPTWTTAVE